jgi:hypothetical protein
MLVFSLTALRAIWSSRPFFAAASSSALIGLPLLDACARRSLVLLVRDLVADARRSGFVACQSLTRFAR